MARNCRRGQFENMVSQILMLLALASASPVEGSGGAHAEARVSATIQRGVEVRAARITVEASLPPTVARPPRLCGTLDKPEPDCRLIIYDLP
jgi:hypothetical protein